MGAAVNGAPGAGMSFPGGRIVTFSFDDGVTQDRRLAAMFKRYALKATFNINSGLLGCPGRLNIDGRTVSHDKIAPGEAASLYHGHEVAAHTLTHPDLTRLSDAEVIRQAEEDRRALEALMGVPVFGMAYPGGGVNHDDRVVRLIRGHTGVRYARTVLDTGGFGFPGDPLRLRPTVHAADFDRLEALLDAFLALDPRAPALFFIWGHSYEFDLNDGWTRFERFCDRVSNLPGVRYLTNAEALGMS